MAELEKLYSGILIELNKSNAGPEEISTIKNQITRVLATFAAIKDAEARKFSAKALARVEAVVNKSVDSNIEIFLSKRTINRLRAENNLEKVKQMFCGDKIVLHSRPRNYKNGLNADRSTKRLILSDVLFTPEELLFNKKAADLRDTLLSAPLDPNLSLRFDPLNLPRDYMGIYDVAVMEAVNFFKKNYPEVLKSNTGEISYNESANIHHTLEEDVEAGSYLSDLVTFSQNLRDNQETYLQRLFMETLNRPHPGSTRDFEEVLSF